MCQRCGCWSLGGSEDSERPSPEGMVEAVLLLLLAERPQPCEELVAHLIEDELLDRQVHPRRVGHLLERLVAGGWVTGTHDPRQAGRQLYGITMSAQRQLAQWREGVGRYRTMGSFIREYEQKHARLPGHPAPRETRRAT